MSLSALSNAFSGMQAASLRLEAVASNVANVSTPGYEPVGVELSPTGGGVAATLVARSSGGGAKVEGLDNLPRVDLASEMVDMLMASIQYKANTKVAAVASGMAREGTGILA